MNEMLHELRARDLAGVLMVLAVLVLLFARLLPADHDPLGAAAVARRRRSLALLAHATGRSRSPSVIGILMLMGIVAKNSILLVDFAIEREARGQIPARGAARGRPQARAADRHDHRGDDRRHAADALGSGGDCDFRQPMAIAVIGGLITSTALTLVMVPAVFTWIDDIERFRLAAACRASSSAPRPPRPPRHPGYPGRGKYPAGGRRRQGAGVAAVPPAAAERLKQVDRVDVAAGHRADKSDAGLLVGLLRGQQRHVVHGARIVLALDQLEPVAGRFQRVALGVSASASLSSAVSVSATF